MLICGWASGPAFSGSLSRMATAPTAPPTERPSIDRDPDVPDRLRLGGAWTLPHAAWLERELARGGGLAATGAAAIDARQVTRLDSAGAMLLRRLAAQLGVGPEALLLAPAHTPLLGLVADADEPARPARPASASAVRVLLERIGASTVEVAVQGRTLLGFLGLTLATLARLPSRRVRLRWTPTVHHMEQTGLDAVPLVAVLNFLVGAVVAYLGANVLRDFGAEIYVVELVSAAFLREFGVLLTAILLAGRTASAFTAQIGSMKSREEIDAIRTLGLDPIELLVLPRLIALVVMLPLLAFLATLSGILGGMAVAAGELGLSAETFLARFQETFWPANMAVGLAKAPIFAAVIALIGCLEGFKVAGTAQSVGERTTSSVVQAIFLVILIDAIAAVFTMEMGW